jgi:hypothetical protein
MRKVMGRTTVVAITYGGSTSALVAGGIPGAESEGDEMLRNVEPPASDIRRRDVQRVQLDELAVHGFLIRIDRGVR